MPTKKQILKTKYWWGKIKPGAEITVYETYIKYAYKFTHEGDTVRRMFGICDNEYLMKDEYGNLTFYVIGPSGKYIMACVDPDDVEFITMPKITKEFRSKATKDSVWRFHSDWTFAGYDGKLEEHTIPAGTEFKITKAKFFKALFGPSFKSNGGGVSFEESAINIEFASDIDLSSMIRNVDGTYLPAREIIDYIELVEHGATKTYWQVLNDAGEKLLSKRYKNVSAIKASLRLRFGFIDDPDEVDYWFENLDELDLSNGAWAVQYDYATDKEISREDMKEYITLAKLQHG